MFKKSKVLLWGFAGVIPAWLLLAAAEELLRGLSGILLTFGSTFGLGIAETEQYAVIVEQLQDAKIRLPIFMAVIFCCAAGVLTAWVLGKTEKKLCLRITLAVLFWVCFVPVLFIGVLWFTQVNGIRFGAVLRCVLALL